MENWKPVVGFEGCYEVSNIGRVRTVDSGYIFNPQPTQRGYLRVTFRMNDRRKAPFVHVLVLEAFVCPRPPGKVTNHKNSDKTDNRVENLEWVTQRENVTHAIETGNFFTPRGEQSGNSKLTANDVKEIRRLYAGGQYTQSGLAQRFDVTGSLISAVVCRRIWKHV